MTLSDQYRIYGSPHRYVQGPGALASLADWTERLGNPAVIISDVIAWNLARPVIEKSYADRAMPNVVLFSGDVTYETVENTVKQTRMYAPGVVVGLGGGKALDVGKGVANALGVRVITVPTIASNDSPTSRSIAIYDEQHVLKAVERGEYNPALVLVDTSLIVGAPVRFLRSGIGDAIAKKFEGEAVDLAGGIQSHGTRPLRTGLIIADGCYRILRQYAAEGVRANIAGEITEAFERTVEACVLMSGLGFENSGLSIAHSVTRGLMAAPSTAGSMHGEHVAYGLLIQMHTEGRPPEFIADLLNFYGEVGLPRRLSDLGMNCFDERQARLIAERTMTAPHIHNVPRPVDTAMLMDAMRQLESA